jgi:hypothetical protein
VYLEAYRVSNLARHFGKWNSHRCRQAFCFLKCHVLIFPIMPDRYPSDALWVSWEKKLLSIFTLESTREGLVKLLKA